MKKFSNFKFLGALALMFTLAFTSCVDPCKDVACVNGECVEGDCVCDTGYEGTLCDALMQTKFVGNYNLDEICDSGSDNYAATITASATNIEGISINNLYDSGLNTTATVSSSTITIESQTFGNGTISGTGSINTDETVININYTVTVGGQTDACIATLTKQ